MTLNELIEGYAELLTDSRNTTAERRTAETAKALADNTTLRLRAKLASTKAEVDSDVRERLAATPGAKVTDAGVAAGVASHPSVVRLADELIEAEQQRNNAEADIESLRAIDRDLAYRAQHLNALGSLLRDEARASLLSP